MVSFTQPTPRIKTNPSRGLYQQIREAWGVEIGAGSVTIGSGVRGRTHERTVKLMTSHSIFTMSFYLSSQMINSNAVITVKL